MLPMANGSNESLQATEQDKRGESTESDYNQSTGGSYDSNYPTN